jgi:hypothetical protein
MRLIVVLIACFGCSLYAEPGAKYAEMYTVLKPGPIRHPAELLEPTRPQEQCGAACRAEIVEVPVSPAAEPQLESHLRSARR